MNKFLRDEYYEAHDIPALKPVLAKWIAVQREYTRQIGDDFAWNYRERTSIGFLAAAAWKAGGVALEEWRTEKGPRNDPRKGRCDLYIYRRRQSFHIEAKHMWSCATGKQPNAISYIERQLKRAVADAKLLQCPRKEKLGLLFVAPFYSARKQTHMTDHIATWLKGIYEIPHSAIAWLFLDRRKLKSHPKSNVVPGIVLIVRYTKKVDSHA